MKNFLRKNIVIATILIILIAVPNIFKAILLSGGGGWAAFVTGPLAIAGTPIITIILLTYLYLWVYERKIAFEILNLILITLAGFITVYCIAKFNITLYTILFLLILFAFIFYNNNNKNFILKNVSISLLIFTTLFCFVENKYNILQPKKNYLTAKMGYKVEYCEAGSCKIHKIPRKYDKIEKLTPDLNNYCPYFKAKKDGEIIYLDRFNNKILQEFENIEIIDIYKNSKRAKPSYKPYNLNFKVKKNGKYGLTEISSHNCKNNIKLILPCEYDDIELGILSIPEEHSFLNYIITKQNNYYNLYIKEHFSTDNYKLILKNKRNIDIYKEYKDIVKLENGLKISPQSYRCTKIISDNNIIYLGTNWLIEKNKFNYYEIKKFNTRNLN